LQFAVEPIAVAPIYIAMKTFTATKEMNMQPDAILRFLADSRRYLDR